MNCVAPSTLQAAVDCRRQRWTMRNDISADRSDRHLDATILLSRGRAARCQRCEDVFPFAVIVITGLSDPA